MVSFRWKNYQWIHVVVAGGSVGLTGCVDRAYDFGIDGNGPPGSGTDSDGPDPTGGPTDPTDPTDPTVGPVDPPPGIPGAPQLIDVQFLDNLTLQLAFNEPMASPEAVDPTAFRLSLAQGADFEPYYGYGYGYYGYKWTFYNDLRSYNGEEICTEYCWDNCYDYYDPYCYDGKYCYEWCYSTPGPRVTAFQLTLDANNPSLMQLRFDNGVGPGVCNRTTPYDPAEPYVEGLFLHYTDDFAPVVDSQGEALAPISETWALQSSIDNSYEPGSFFPRMEPFLPIPCPF